MSLTQDDQVQALNSFNRLMEHLSGAIVEESRQARDVIRRRWSGKLLNSHITMAQCRFGFAWLKEVLGSDFRADGNYEDSITKLVTTLGVWPDNMGENQELTVAELKLISK